MLSRQCHARQKNHLSSTTATHSHRLADWQARSATWVVHYTRRMQEIMHNILFRALLGLVHKQTLSLIQILATEVRILKNEFNILTLRTAKTIRFDSK